MVGIPAGKKALMEQEHNEIYSFWFIISVVILENIIL
jgi:hypothetical protein